MAELTPTEKVCQAAMQVLLGVSENNLAHGTTGTVLVDREHLKYLEATLEEAYPGLQAEIRAGMRKPPTTEQADEKSTN